MLDKLLEKFIADEGVDAEMILQACEIVGDAGIEYSCIDWILGSTEFSFFLAIAKVFYNVHYRPMINVVTGLPRY